jgi:hypothetical protein
MRYLLAVAMAIMGLSTASFAGPKVSIPEKHWDFGNVPQNSTISHAYWIMNIGDDTLKIINVKPG